MIDLTKVKIIPQENGILCIRTRNDKRGDLFGGTLYLGVLSISELDAAIDQQQWWADRLVQAGNKFMHIGDEMTAKYGDLNHLSAEEEQRIEAAWQAVEEMDAQKPYRNFVCDKDGPVKITQDGKRAVGNDGTVYELVRENYWKRQRPM